MTSQTVLSGELIEFELARNRSILDGRSMVGLIDKTASQ